MAKLSVEQALEKAKSHTKKGELAEAQALYSTILKAFPNNKKAQRGLAASGKATQPNATQSSPQAAINQLANLFNQGQLALVAQQAERLIKDYPNNFVIWSFMGGANLGLGQAAKAAKAFSRVTQLNPNYPEGHNNLGSALQKLGRYEESLKCFRNALSLNPDYSDAYYNIGISCKELSKLDLAIESFELALALNPTNWKAYGNIGVAFKDKSEWAEAVVAYRKALAINPNDPGLILNLGNALQEQGKLEEAIGAYNKLLFLKPDYADAYLNIGNALKEQDKLEEAIDSYRQAIKIKPEYTEAHFNLGDVLANKGELGSAIESYRQTIKLAPDYAEAHNNMGLNLRAMEDLDFAIESFKRAIKFKPDFVEAHNNLGITLRDKGEFDTAIDSLKLAIMIDPDFVKAHKNMGDALIDNGDLVAAIDSLKLAIMMDPDFADAYFSLGLAFLTDQKFKKGFDLLEWRWKVKENIGLYLLTSKPLWRGEKGQTVFIWAEQGIGDVIMFASLIPELYAISLKLIVQCDERLIPLFQRSFPKDITYQSDRGLITEDSYDFHTPIGSLARIFRTSLKSFQKTAGNYLIHDKAKTKKLRAQLLSGGAKTLIGISWKTGAIKKSLHNFNIDLFHLARTLDSPNLQLVCLQYGDVSGDIDRLKKEFGINVRQVSEIDNRDDIDGLSSLIMACDKIISTSNVTLPLSGALGADTKALVPQVSLWFWGQNTNNSILYRSLKLYRKTSTGWQSALSSVKSDLKRELDGS